MNKKLQQGIRLLGSVIWRNLRVMVPIQYFPLKPTVLHFLINDVYDQSSETKSDDLGKILADPLFSQIRHMDLSGDENALRQDASEMTQVLIKSLPKLKTLCLITNALQPQAAIEQSLTLVQVLQTTGIRLKVSVSLDGIGVEHDHIQGAQGNFVSAVELIKSLKQNSISVSVNCTLTPINYYSAEDVLIWCEQNDIQEYDFRLGVDFNRLDNEGFSPRHTFTPDQRFHLVIFFEKLAGHHHVDLARRLFYKSLVDQLAFGLHRQTACDWQTRGVTLDMRGNISFCPMQSSILGSAVEKSVVKIFMDGISERHRIVREHCSSCQHDFTGPVSIGELARLGRDRVFKQFQQRRYSLLASSRPVKSILPADRNVPSEWRHVLITGWYGTETAGDKAILGETLHFLKTYAPSCQVTLTTLDRKISQQTQLELNDLQGATQVDMAKGFDPALIESVDAVIIGGGPLMENRYMEYIRRMFMEANRQRKARIVFGCGVGPLHTDRMRQITNAIFQMTTAGFLRDEESYEYAQRFAPDNSLGYACDPALAFLQRWLNNHPKQVSSESELLRIAGLLRANTNEFIVDQIKSELGDSNMRVAEQLAQIFETACSTDNRTRVDLLHMNAPNVGGDDRIFNRRVASFFNNPEVVHVKRSYLSLETLLQSLQLANSAVAMRYHGHLFCMALGIPFLSVDYTGETGKVHRLIKRIGYQQWAEGWNEIDVRRAADRLISLLEERAYWSAYLQQQTDKLITVLHLTYTQVFNVPRGDT